MIKKIASTNVKISEQKKFQRGRSIIVLKSTIKSIKNFDSSEESKFYTYDSFPVETTLTFNFNKLVSIFQRYFIPEQFIINYAYGFQIGNFKDSYLNSKEYIETLLNILSDEFINTFKSKYGEENYTIDQKYENWENGYKILTHYDYEKIWLKNGVLINFSKETNAVDYVYNRFSRNNLNLENLTFASIKYCGVKRYFYDVKDNQIFMDSIFEDSKKIDKKIKTDSIKNVKSSGL